MKKPFFAIFLMLAMGLNSTAQSEWLTSLPDALVKAKAENKAVMLDFTGSDWCGWCKKLKAEVFDQPEFQNYAKAKLVLVEVDFPKSKPLSTEQAEANRDLAVKFGVQGFPTVFLLDANGTALGRTGYAPGGPPAFIAALEKLPAIAAIPSPTPVPGDAAAAPAETTAPKKAEPQFVPIPPQTPNKYGDIALKGISGQKNNRLVMINNATLATGETGRVKVRDGIKKVTVKEIKDDSAIIVVDGQTAEIKLAHSLGED